jgi:GNAT superfamily N-acetyltransferase
LVKALRLASLADSPDAFLSTLADEEAMSNAAWRARLASNAAGLETAGFLALVGGEARGLVVGVRREDRADSVNLNALWVAPDARGLGAGRALVDAVCRWAQQIGRTRVTLAVVEKNDAATAFYRACGFAETQRTVREEGGRSRTEISMVRLVCTAPTGAD